MNSEQFNELRMSVLSVEQKNREAMAEYHEALTAYLLDGVNTFTREMLLNITNNFSVIPNKNEIINFILERLQEPTKETEEQPNYIPNFPDWATGWAIDSNAVAYYYKDEAAISLCNYSWQGFTKNLHDNDFDAEKFVHMWVDGNWRNSKIVKENTKKVETYTPYKPDFTNFPSANGWAIDESGSAYYLWGEISLGNKTWWPNGDSELDSDFKSDKHKQMWENGAWRDSLVENQQTIYTPVFKGEDESWSIDNCGVAYFYLDTPECLNTMWMGISSHSDKNFDPKKYPHMWKNGEWRNSLRKKQK